VEVVARLDELRAVVARLVRVGVLPLGRDAGALLNALTDLLPAVALGDLGDPLGRLGGGRRDLDDRAAARRDPGRSGVGLEELRVRPAGLDLLAGHDVVAVPPDADLEGLARQLVEGPPRPDEREVDPLTLAFLADLARVADPDLLLVLVL